MANTARKESWKPHWVSSSGEARRIAHSMLSAIEKSSDAIEGAAECLEAILIENT